MSETLSSSEPQEPRKTTPCACPKCADLCQHRPGWFAPGEATKPAPTRLRTSAGGVVVETATPEAVPPLSGHIFSSSTVQRPTSSIRDARASIRKNTSARVWPSVSSFVTLCARGFKAAAELGLTLEVFFKTYLCVDFWCDADNGDVELLSPAWDTKKWWEGHRARTVYRTPDQGLPMVGTRARLVQLGFER